jgi:hypothetical protein
MSDRHAIARRRAALLAAALCAGACKREEPPRPCLSVALHPCAGGEEMVHLQYADDEERLGARGAAESTSGARGRAAGRAPRAERRARARPGARRRRRRVAARARRACGAEPAGRAEIAADNVRVVVSCER